MNVIFEFLSNEPIENLITSIHFKVDKVIYFGYQETIDELKIRTMNFLSKHLGVNSSVFYSMPHTDMQSMMETMREVIEKEIDEGNKIYFDMTGGEDTIIAAFGMLAGEYDTPMHVFNVYEDRITKLEEGSHRSIITELEPRDFKLDLDMVVEMHGGRINYSLHKSVKSLDDPEFAEDVEKLWSVENDYIEEWNLLSIFLRNYMMPENGLNVKCDLEKIDRALKRSNNHLDSMEKFNAIMDRLGEHGILKDLKHEDGEYSFSYKSRAVKDCLKEGGSVLELYVYKREQPECDDCRIGVHLDWDGVIHYSPGIDVLNEIDVLTLKGNIPTFISCKTGKMGPTNSLHALYELETVANRFGGKYAKKKLVTSRPLVDVYLKRAEEMGIEVEQ
ncbi:MAG: DUF1887 family protein [Firmicutes bacterium]|nr:DUF1887 family protein [Bacillota bacterium]